MNRLITMGLGNNNKLVTVGMGGSRIVKILREVLRLISLIDFRPGGH